MPTPVDRLFDVISTELDWYSFDQLAAQDVLDDAVTLAQHWIKKNCRERNAEQSEELTPQERNGGAAGVRQINRRLGGL